MFPVLAFLMACVIPVLASAEDNKPGPLDPIRQQNATTIALPADDHRLVPDADGGLLLLCGDRLAMLEADGITIKREVRLPRHYSDIAARKDYFVAVSEQDKVIELIDRKTFKAVWSKQPPTKPPARVEPHPHLPISYISLKSNDGEFLVLEEGPRKLRSTDGWVGQSLRVDPRGQFMLAGVSHTMKVGTRMEHLGRHLHEVPVYKTLNLLVRYHLHEGRPVMSDFREAVGGGIEGIRLSPNGLGVVVLSRTGYPQGSKNLAIWDALDFEALPNALKVKEGGSSKDLAFHPVLPLVASPGEKTAVFFHAESGEAEPTRLTDTDKLPKGMVTDRVRFSPDGLNVLLGGKVGEKRVLVASTMRVGLTEELWIEQGPPQLKPVRLPEVELPQNEDRYENALENTTQWITTNNAFGPDHALAKDVVRVAGESLRNGKGYSFLLGPGLTKSGKPTLLAVHAGEFFVHELTDEQYKVSGLGEKSMSQWAGVPFDRDAPYTPVRLEPPTVQHEPGGPVTGTVVAENRGEITNALFGMTLTYTDGGKTVTSIHHLGDWLTNTKKNDLKFSFGNPANDADKPKLIIGYLEMVAFKVSRRQGDRISISKPQLVVFVAKPGP